MKRTTRTRIAIPRSIKRLFPQVDTAVDAQSPVEISVDAKDCQSGKKRDPSECALARAAKRELHADGVIIGISTSYIVKGKTAVRFATPESVRREIVSFDRHQDFAPGDYYLQPKSPTGKFGESHRRLADRDHGESHNEPPRRKIHQSARVRVLAKGAA